MSGREPRMLDETRAAATRWLRPAVSALLVVTVVAAAASGCGRRASEKPKPDEIVKSVDVPDADLTVTVRVQRRAVTIADTFRCAIEIARGRDVAAVMPARRELETCAAPLIVRDVRPLPERVENGRVVETTEYTLEPLVPDTYTIKPLAVTYTAGEHKGTVETEPIELSVTSLGADDPAAEPRDIAGPVEMPAAPPRWWAWSLIGGAVVAGAFCAWLLIRRHRRRGVVAAARRLAAHEIAYNALRELREKDYVRRGMVKAFYVELSAILRVYIENRFGLRAPEQTTEEFLAHIARDGHFDQTRRGLLRAFLEHCDLVKFARYGPSTGEIDGALGSATAFVDETKEAPSDAV